jgi:hypothetical protein
MTEVAEMPVAVESKTVSQDSGLWENIQVHNVPANMNAWVSLLGEDKCCEKLQQSVMVHSHLVKFRTALCAWLDANSGFGRESSTNDKGKKIYPKSEGWYISRVGDYLEENDRSPSEFQEDVQRIMDSINYQESAQTRVRGAGEAKPGKKYLGIAETLEEEGRLDDFIAVQGLVVTGLDDDEKIIVAARKIRNILLEKARKAEEEALSALKA